jgi:membrane protein YdbS with pleckstrin-like domain
MKYKRKENYAAIPIVVIWVIALIALTGAGLITFSDIRKEFGGFIFAFMVLIVFGLFVIPNLPQLIRWTKNVIREIKK